MGIKQESEQQALSTAQINEIRRGENQKIKGVGKIIAAVNATRIILNDGGIESAQDAYLKGLNLFNSEKTTRKTRIKLIRDTENMCRTFAQIYDPDIEANSALLEARRRKFTSIIIENKFADGEMAVQVSNLLLGIGDLGINDMQIVKDEDKLPKR